MTPSPWLLRAALAASVCGAGLAHGADLPAAYVCQMVPTEHPSDKPGICPGDGLEMVDKNHQLTVAVLVFDGVEEIDYTGPIEVLGASGNTIYTVAASKAPVRSAYGLNVLPDYDIDTAPKADVLIVPGGGIGAVLKDPKVIAWVRQQSDAARVVMSVCTGAFILGKAGLLDGIASTTIAPGIDNLARLFPKTRVVRNQRFVDNGKFITTGGLSSGIDGALHLVEREQGRLRAFDIARYMEYDWHGGERGSFATLAAMRLPAMGSILPPGLLWQRTVDEGDGERWRIRGQLGAPDSAQVLLDKLGQNITAKGWQANGGDASARRFVTTHEGQAWAMTLSLAAKRLGAANYQLDLAVAKVAAR